MGPSSHQAHPIPKNAIPVLALMLAFMAFTAWNQSYWWITLEEDHFGWLTPHSLSSPFTIAVQSSRPSEMNAAPQECRFEIP
jgi:hypothetical protein